MWPLGRKLKRVVKEINSLRKRSFELEASRDNARRDRNNLFDRVLHLELTMKLLLTSSGKEMVRTPAVGPEWKMKKVVKRKT